MGFMNTPKLEDLGAVSPRKDKARAKRRSKASSALFALAILAGTLVVLVVLFNVVGQPTAPDSYPGLNGFPKTGNVPTKTAGDVVSFIFAMLVGFLIQRSRWCNASAVRDAILFKSFRNTKPLVLGMIIITAMFTIFEAANVGTPIAIAGGAFTVLGLFIFGIGMVLGGACTVSVWVRSAEGSFGALWALLYTLIGMFLFSELWNVMRWPAANYLQTTTPNMSILSFGSFNALSIRSMFGPVWGPVAVIVAGGIQVAVLALIYRRFVRIERRAAKSAFQAAYAGLDADGVLTVSEILAAGHPTSGAILPDGDFAERGVGLGETVKAASRSASPTASEVLGSGADAIREVDLPGWGVVSISKVVDCSGEMCPRPQLLTKRAVVREMAVGQVLELVVDNPSSPELVPTIMNDIGALHLCTERDSLAWHLFIRKERDMPQRNRGGGQN